MKIINYIVILALAIITAYFLFNQSGCSSREVIKLVHDSIPVNVIINKVEIRDTGTTKTVYLPAKADSNVLQGLLGQMDSLRRELSKAQVRSLFSMDTITIEQDKIHVDCDEISRSIALKIEFGKREVMLPRDREVILQTEKPTWSIGIGGGAVFTLPDGQVKYGITANLQYNIFTF